MTQREAVEALKSRHSRLQELSQSQQPGYVMRGIMAELHAQAIGIALLEGQTPDKPTGYTLEDALHYLERRRSQSTAAQTCVPVQTLSRS